MIYGVIGVGSIATSIVVGLCDGVAAPPTMLLSPRNAGSAAELAARFPTVRVCTDNQAVINRADTVLVCLRPRDAEAVLDGLRFRADQAVVSAMAGVTVERVARLVAPARDIARAIPLPAVAQRRTATPIHPATGPAHELFARLGGAMVPTDEAAFDALSAASGTVAAHLAALGSIVRWLEGHGISERDGTRYVASIYAALADPLRAGRDFDELAKEFTTPGGLNALFRGHMEDAGSLAAVTTGLDRLLVQLGHGSAPADSPRRDRR